MTMIKHAGAIALLVAFLSAPAQLMAQQQQQTPQQQQAQQQGVIDPDPSNLYVGAGVAWNSISRFDDAVGWQIFAGLDFFRRELLTLAAELGFFSSGDFDRTTTINGTITDSIDADGIWLNGTITYNLRDFIENSYVIGRLGLDFGDDDGFMIGIGAGYAFTPNIDARLEFVGRDNIDSLILNGLFRF